MDYFAEMLVEQKRYEEAETVWKECLAISAKASPKKFVATSFCHMNLGKLLTTVKRYAEAEEHLVKGYEAFREGAGKNHKVTREALNYLIQFYKKQGKTEKVKEYSSFLPSRGGAEK